MVMGIMMRGTLGDMDPLNKGPFKRARSRVKKGFSLRGLPNTTWEVTLLEVTLIELVHLAPGASVWSKLILQDAEQARVAAEVLLAAQHVHDGIQKLVPPGMIVPWRSFTLNPKPQTVSPKP